MPFIQSENGRRIITPWQKANSRLPADIPRAGYYWAAFSEAPDASTRASLNALGAELLGFAGRSQGALLYKVRVGGRSGEVRAYLRSRPGFLNLLPISAQDKLAARYYGLHDLHNLRQGAGRRGQAKLAAREKATVYFHGALPWSQVQSLLAGRVDSVIYDPEPNFVHVAAEAGRIRALGDLEEVWRVGPYMPRYPTGAGATDCAHVRDITKVAELQNPTLDTLSFPPSPEWNRGRPFTGEGIWICVNEGIDSTHLDFRESMGPGRSRLRRGVVETWTSSFHGTHVAGIAAGNGWNSKARGGYPYEFRGVAPKSTLLPYWESGDVNNHSFTNGFEGYYNYADAGVDERFSNHNGILLDANNVAVWAAANNGGRHPQYGAQRGYYSLLVNAKNPLKVAASNAQGTGRAVFSSMGPTRDGRIGPDVTAPGDGIRAAWEGSQDYTFMSGTSMAAPHVTGIVALLLQKYQEEVLAPAGVLDIHNNPPWNSTVKAILIHTAQDMVDLDGSNPEETSPEFTASGYPGVAPLYGEGPDFATGYGMVDARRAAQYMHPSHFVQASVGTGRTRSYTLEVPEGQEKLRVTLAWDDPPFLGVNDESGAFSRKLVNNLDLRLVSPSGQVHLPWVLDHSHMHTKTIPADGLDPVTPAAIREYPARRGKDDLNNVEVVDVGSPEAGEWTVEVAGFEVPVDQSLDAGANQDFSLVSDLSAQSPPPPPQADLVVTDVAWGPATPSPAERVRFRATLRNIGEKATPQGVPCGVTLYVAGVAVARSRDHLDSLAPGAEITLEGDMGLEGGDGSWAAYSGVVAVAAAADPANAISEASETNNARLETMEVPKFPRPWFMHDVGKVGFPGFGYYFDNTFYVTGEGADIYGTQDAFNFVHQEVGGPVEIRAKLNWVDNTHGWAKAGLMLRENLSAGSRHVMIVATPENGVAFQYRTQAGGITMHAGKPGFAPMHLRLVRAGNLFSGYSSLDGATWTPVGSVAMPMADTLQAGMAVTSHQLNSSTTGSFSDVTVTPLAPQAANLPIPEMVNWAETGDIGAVGGPGGIEYANGVYTMTGSGADIWGSSDGFQFASLALPGDGEITARVIGIEETEPWAKAGVMIRESLSPVSRHAFMAFSAGAGGVFLRRVKEAEGSVSTAAAGSGAPFWVRLTRTGDLFRGYHSADGITWTEAGQETIPMAGELRIGLAVTAHTNAAVCTATFDNVSVKLQPGALQSTGK